MYDLKRLGTMIGVVSIASFAAGVAFGASPVTVPGTASPYLAGMPDGSSCCNGDAAPAQSPVQVPGLALTPGAVLMFSVAGSVTFLQGATATDPPDGSFFFTGPHGEPGTPSSNGIAGMNAPVDALVGVFLDDSAPNASPTPPSLDFSAASLGTSFSALCPGLKQVFFIGDGWTGNGAGTMQQFVVPPGATRLFLGTVDGFGWFTNSGSFTVQATSTTAAPTSPAPACAPLINLAASVNQSTFSVGQTLTTTLAASNAGQRRAADFYTGLVMPDGATIQFFTGGGIVFGNLADPGSFHPIATGVSLDGPFSVTVPNFSSHQWTDSDARGTYVFFILAVEANSLATGNLSGDNVFLGVAVAPFSFP